MPPAPAEEEVAEGGWAEVLYDYSSEVRRAILVWGMGVTLCILAGPGRFGNRSWCEGVCH